MEKELKFLVYRKRKPWEVFFSSVFHTIAKENYAQSDSVLCLEWEARMTVL